MGRPGDTLIDALEAVASTSGRFTFVGGAGEMTVSSLWRRSRGCVERFRDCHAVAAVMTTSPDAVSVLFGAVRAGARLVSLPLPPRGPGLEAYIATLQHAVSASGAAVVLADAPILDLLPPFTVPAMSFQEALAGPPAEGDSGSFSLVQFSSGTTGDPKGVVLSEAALRANLAAMVDRIPADLHQCLVSWLPLSHDMGLIGGLLASLWAGKDIDGHAANLVLMRPEHFVARPADWLRACSDFGATITLAPDFAFRRVAALDLRAISLSRLEACLTGAEPIRPSTLRMADDVLGAVGMPATALCPAYGCAELTLAATIHRPRSRWEATTLPAYGTVAGEPVLAEIVSSGEVLAGTDVRVDEDDFGLGPISVRSPSLLTSYVDGSVPLVDGWYLTGDFGAIEEGRLHVIGRLDEVVVVGGRNVSGTQIQHVVESVPGVRVGAVVAVADTQDGGYVVLCESRARDDVRLCDDVRLALGRSGLPNPTAVGVVSDGSVPRTPSGKPRRHLAEGLLASGELSVRHMRRYR